MSQDQTDWLNTFFIPARSLVCRPAQLFFSGLFYWGRLAVKVCVKRLA